MKGITLRINLRLVEMRHSHHQYFGVYGRPFAEMSDDNAARQYNILDPDTYKYSIKKLDVFQSHIQLSPEEAS